MFLKPKPTMEKPTTVSAANLAIYFLLVLLGQFGVNASTLVSKCGGSLSENMTAAFTLTFFPWLLLFGAVIAILQAYPGFKSAFADVIGYFYVSSAANIVLTELLVNKDVQDKLPANISDTEKDQMMEAADTIIKIAGNTSVLINQMVPSNFAEFWNVLQPLMKSEYQQKGDGMSETTEAKKKLLFDLVASRDNVGEAMWYIYTGFLIISVVQLQINTRGCTMNPKQMAKNYQNYLAEQEKTKAATELATSTEYTVTG
jgi:hypothetical protein